MFGRTQPAHLTGNAYTEQGVGELCKTPSGAAAP